MSRDSDAIRILTVDDHPLLRDGIAGLIADEPDMLLAGEAANGREAIEQFRRLRPDVTLMDLQMPEMSGLDALIAIRTEFPDAKVIVLVMQALKAGAFAYLLKNLLRKELLTTIRAVHAGKKALSPEVSFELAEHAVDSALSPAEVRVLRLVAQGHSNREIAAHLSATEEAIKSHVRGILAKLDANDRTHAVVIALKRGIMEL